MDCESRISDCIASENEKRDTRSYKTKQDKTIRFVSFLSLERSECGV